MKRLDFLNKLAFFKGWERVKLSDYNHMADEIKVTEGQTIYDIGQNASTFYVVRGGKLTMETIIEIDSFFKIPVGRGRWEIRKTTRRIQYKLQELSKGSMFGHEEMLLGYDRRCRIRALTNCTLIYINKPEMDICFPPEQFDVLRGKMRNLELDQIVKKIGKYYKDKATTNQAILDATKVNTDNFGGRKMKLMTDVQQKQVNKLLPWLQKAKSNKTQNQNILHEIRKVKLLSTREEKYTVTKEDTHSDSEDVESEYSRYDVKESMMHKKKARFVMPEEAQKKLSLMRSQTKYL